MKKHEFVECHCEECHGSPKALCGECHESKDATVDRCQGCGEVDCDSCPCGTYKSKIHKTK